MTSSPEDDNRDLSFISSGSCGSTTSDGSTTYTNIKGEKALLSNSLIKNGFSADLLSSNSSNGKRSDVSGYLSDVSCSSFIRFSEWSSEFQRKRSPCSKIYLSDIKDKLLEEVKNVDNELITIEKEKQALLNVRFLLVNLQNALWESERNSQGLLVPEKLKKIIENTVPDVCGYEEAVILATGIPCSEELRTCLRKVREIIRNLSQGLFARLKIEDIEDLFSQCGQLYGIVDAILIIFYEQDFEKDYHDFEHTDENKNSAHIGNQNSITAINHVDSPICGKCFEQVTLNVDDVPPGSGLFDIEKRITKEYGRGEAKYLNGRSSVETEKPFIIADQKSIIECMVKDIGKIKKELKSVERMTSGRLKMKNLVNKFQKVSSMFKVRHLKGLDTYPCVLEGNVRKFQEVLRMEKPGQCDLDNIRFLLFQLAGRATILLRLETGDEKL